MATPATIPCTIQALALPKYPDDDKEEEEEEEQTDMVSRDESGLVLMRKLGC